jgi:hypothetical protein
MSSPPLRGTAEWSATREVALLLGLTGGNRYAAQQLWLRKERIKAEASQFASAGSQQASQQPAGCRAEPAPARAQAVPRWKTAAQLARSERSRERLFRKHLAKVAKVRPRLQAWLRRARASLRQPMELTQPVPPAGPPAAALPPPPALAVGAQPSDTSMTALWQRYTARWLAVCIATKLVALLRRARLRLRACYIWSYHQVSRVNALAAAYCAEHDPLPPSAIRLVPSTPPRSRRTAAEGVSRATKRDALADSPSRAPAHPKKTRAVGSVQAALAAAAPPQPPQREPITATNYAAAALAAAANPHPPSA